MSENEEKFLAEIRRQLDQSSNNLDQDTLRRLRQARMEAVADSPRRNPVWFSAPMVASVAVLAVTLWLVMPDQQQPVPAFDDMEMLVDVEEPEFYQDLDFYYWLEQQYDKS